MTDDALAKAISGLNILDVFLNSSSSSLAEIFDPKYDERAANLGYQTKCLVTGSEILEISNAGESGLIFRVRSEMGVRLACKEEFENEDLDYEPDVLAIVEGVMFADYVITDVSLVEDEGALQVFALKNTPYHVWPYWREFVSSQMLRMNMPKVVLPMRLRAGNE